MIENQSRVCLQNDILQFNPEDQFGWEFPVNCVKSIIEYTTEEGPFAPDHFLVFVDGSVTEYHLPLDTEGSLDVIEQIGNVLGANIDLKLFSSTEFASRVVFPDSIAEEEGYRLEKTPDSFIQKIFCFGQKTKMILSDEIREEVTRTDRT